MMDKILLLDWGGPVINNRTWKMPGSVDPVAIKLLNDLTVAGWLTVFTSDMRNQFDGDNPKQKALEYFTSVGFYPQFYKDLWLPGNYGTGLRHLDTASWMAENADDIPDDAVFLIIDDHRFPREMLDRGRMVQIYARSDSGLDYLSISEAYSIVEMNEEELEDHFKVATDEDWDF